MSAPKVHDSCGCVFCDMGLEPKDGVHYGKNLQQAPCTKKNAKEMLLDEAAQHLINGIDERIARWESALLAELSSMARVPLSPPDLVAIIKRARNKMNGE